MKKTPLVIAAIAAAVFSGLLLTAGLADYYMTAAGLDQCPRSTVVEFYARDGSLWTRHVLARRECLPIDSGGDMAPPVMRKIGGILSEAYRHQQGDMAGARWAAAYFLAPELTSPGDKIPLYTLQRLRDYKNMALLCLGRGSEELTRALLNRKRLRPGLYGAGLASRALYGKDFSRLSAPEMRPLLFLLLGNGSKGSGPVPRALRDRYEKALAGLAGNASPPPTGAYFRDYCLSLLKKENLIRDSGTLRVYTTLDLKSQKLLEESVADFLEKYRDQPRYKVEILKSLPQVEAAALILDTKTGALRAMIGGRSYEKSGPYNRAVQSRRQISSTIKPFLYAEALELCGLRGDTMMTDRPVEMKNRDGSPWRPKNFYPGYRGDVPLRDALVVSINTVAVQLIGRVGTERMAGKAREIFRMPDNDMDRRVPAEPSLALGSLDLTPLELAKGYLILAGDGTERLPRAMERITDGSGRDVETDLTRSPPRPGKRFFRQETVREIRGMLKDVIARGTAADFIKEPLTYEIAGKSGSSPGDSWFAGFTSGTLIVTWAGFDRQKEIGRAHV